METIKFRYSKKAGFAALAILLIFGGLLSTTLINNYRAGDVPGTVVFGVFVAVIIFITSVMITARLIPALRGDIALEIDGTGAKDHIRNISVDWKHVEDIGLRPGRSSAMLIFDLKFESDMGKFIAVSLRWVEGAEQEIYRKVLAYFDEAEGIIREDSPF